MPTRALAILFLLLISPAFAQVTPGTSPLSIPKGGTAGGTAAAARTNLGVTATGADTTYNFRANNLSDVASAPTARTNLGLAIGTNVQAWDNDLDCLAALSSTGVISRTGTGTCSAGALALSGLATGTQDTVIGYFGSTTASAATMPNCSNSLTYNTTTHLFGCNVGAGTGTVTTAGTGLTLTGGGTTLGLSTARQTLPTMSLVTTGAHSGGFGANASGTYTTPANVLWLEIRMVGGGAGGNGGNGGGSGGTGGNTCWNTSGAACTTPVFQAGGANPSTTGGSVAGSGVCIEGVGGSNGSSGTIAQTIAISSGGIGSNSFYGGGGASSAAGAGGAAQSDSGSGGAGGGTSATSTTAGTGGAAGAYCYVIINSPAATYTYAVGVGGVGGTAGASASAGGTGAGGRITVIEHYGT